MGSAVAGAVAHLRDAAEAEQRGDESAGLLMPLTEEQRKSNRRLGLILASVAIAFALGFIAKMVLFQ